MFMGTYIDSSTDPKFFKGGRGVVGVGKILKEKKIYVDGHGNAHKQNFNIQFMQLFFSLFLFALLFASL